MMVCFRIFGGAMRKFALLLLAGLLMAGSVSADILYQFTGTCTDFSTGVIMGPVSFSLTMPSPFAGTGATGRGFLDLQKTISGRCGATDGNRGTGYAFTTFGRREVPLGEAPD
jgi:hypothetical protein